ncbi:hypothetical protein D3C71_1403440 [compost metagenome]
MQQNGQRDNQIEESIVEIIPILIPDVSLDVFVEYEQNESHKYDEAQNSNFNQILKEKVMRLTACIRVVLILFIQGSPAAAARTQYWVIFCYFNRILIEGEAFQYAMLLEVDIFQTSLDIGRQNAAYAGADQ